VPTLSDIDAISPASAELNAPPRPPKPPKPRPNGAPETTISV